MSLDRRHLLVAGTAAALTAGAPKAKVANAAATPGDAALNRYLDRVSEHVLRVNPEVATSLGLDTGARAALRSKLSDASMTHIADDRA